MQLVRYLHSLVGTGCHLCREEGRGQPDGGGTCVPCQSHEGAPGSMPSPPGASPSPGLTRVGRVVHVEQFGWRMEDGSEHFKTYESLEPRIQGSGKNK